MKRKDLYNYIKEEIVGALSETTYAGKGAMPTIQKDPKWNTLKSDAKKNALADLNTGGDVELEEMARSAAFIKIGDQAKFNLAKEIFSAGIIHNILNAVEEASEEGITKKALGAKLGIDDANLSTFLTSLVSTGALSKPKASAEEPEEEEPEVPSTEDSEEEDYFKDEEPETEKPEEEEPAEEEPAAVSDKEVEKMVGKTYADLSPEEEKTYVMYRQAIVNKAKTLNNKKSSKDDINKAKAAIDKYKTNADLKKLFAKKGIDLIKFISGEING